MNEIYSKTQGYRIRLARKAIGLTQAQLAKEIKTSQQTIHDYEKNKRGSYADTNLLIKLSTICEVTVDWILKGKILENSRSNIPILTSETFLKWLKYSKSSFSKAGLYLEDNSMVSTYPSNNSFNLKDIIILSINKTATLYDYVIATTGCKKSPLVFRQLLLEKNQYILKPLNETYPTLFLESSIKIVAVAIEHHKLLGS